jgi:phosphohistidine phosphatase
MRRLILFRHAEAAPPSGLRDHERPLSAVGRAEAAQAGVRLAALDMPLDMALMSDSQRTRDTWEVVAPELKTGADVRLEPRLYGAARKDLMDLIRARPDSVKTLIVLGHNPSIADFAVAFAGRGEPASLKRLAHGFPTSGVAVFECDDIEWRKLRWGDGNLTHYLV